MFKTLAVLAAAVATCVAADSLPQLPGEFSSLVIEAIDINQGGTTQPDGSVCCDAQAPECKIQTAYEAFQQYFSVKMQAISNRGPDGSGVVMNFTDSKEYQVDANGNCQAYCPLPRDEQGRLTPLGFPENATNEGKVEYNGRMLTLIKSRQFIPILNITMEVENDYVDTSTTPATPVAFIQDIEPFSEQLGMENTTFSGLTLGTPDSKYFYVKDASSCPMSNQCGSDDSSSSSSSDDNFAAAQLSGYKRVPGTSGIYSALSRSTRFESMLDLQLSFGLPVDETPSVPETANPHFEKLVNGLSDIELYSMLPKGTRMSFDRFTQVLDQVRQQ